MRRLAVGSGSPRWAWAATLALSVAFAFDAGAEPPSKPASSLPGAGSNAPKASGNPQSPPPKSENSAPKNGAAPKPKAPTRPAKPAAENDRASGDAARDSGPNGDAAPGEVRTRNGAKPGAEPAEVMPVAPAGKAAPAKPALPKPKTAKAPAPKLATKPAPKAHQRGRAPLKPSSTLPAGAVRSEPNEAARRVIAAGPTGDERRSERADPELRALREAEKVLFPRPLAGMTPGWSWDLPRPLKGSGPTVSSSGAPPSGPRSLDGDEPSREDAAWLKSLTLPNLPVRLDARVVRYLKFYRDDPRGRAIVRVWAQKSGKYAPSIQAELARAGLPTDLVWLSLIESGHNPTIQSPAGAVGLWQLVPETARLYGLTVDRWVDERLDPKRSTEAAVLYLSDLKQRFGSWELTLAAYNMGLGGLGKAIRKYNTNDFWVLGRQEAGIPWETTLYVPKILATAIVMNNKKAFGIAEVTPAEPAAFDTVLVKPAVSLSRVAAAAQVGVAVLEELNPQLLEARTPPALDGKTITHAVHVPTGKGSAAAQRLAVAGEEEPNLSTYVVRFGDSPRSIATEVGITEQQLSKLNGLCDTELLEPGTILLVPKVIFAATRVRDPEDSVVVVASSEFSYPGKRRVFFRTRQGDLLPTVAEAFGVTEGDLLAWNTLDRGARLQPGMVLQLFVPKNASLDHVRHLEERDVRVLVTGSEAFFDYFEAQNGRKRLRVTVKAGDTLKNVGQRYGMTVGSMERINRRPASEQLKVGETLIVYAPQTAPAVKVAATKGAGATTASELEPLPLLPASLEIPVAGGEETPEAAGER